MAQSCWLRLRNTAHAVLLLGVSTHDHGIGNGKGIRSEPDSKVE